MMVGRILTDGRMTGRIKCVSFHCLFLRMGHPIPMLGLSVGTIENA